MDRKPFLIKAISFLVKAAVIAIPLFITKTFVFEATPEKTFLFFLLIEIALLLWLCIVLRNRAYLPRRQPILIAGAIFLFIFTLAGVYGENFESSFWSSISRMSGLLLIYHVAIFVLILSTTIRDEGTWKSIFSLSVWTATLVAILSFLETRWFDFSGISSVGGSTIGNTSYAGIYLVCNIILAVTLARIEIGPKKRLYLFAAGAMTLSPLITNLWRVGNIFQNPLSLLGDSRAATISLIIGLVVYLSIQYKNKYFRVVAATLILSVVFISALALIKDTPVQRALSEVSGSRFLFWESAASGIAEKPILGWGQENYSVPFYKYFQPELYSETHQSGREADTDKPHNAYLELIVAGGILSLLSYISLVYLTFRSLAKTKFVDYSAALIAVLTAYIIFSFYFFDTLVGYLVFALVVGFAASDKLEYPEITRKWKYSYLAPLPIVLSLWFFLIVPYRQQKILSETFVLPNDINYSKLFGMSPSGRQSIIVYLADKNSNELPIIINERDPDIVKIYIDNINKTRIAMTPYVEENKNNYRLLKNYTRLLLAEEILTEEKDLLKAAEAYEALLFTLSPNNPEPYWIKAQRELIEGEKESAVKSIESALIKWPEIQLTHSILEKIMNSQNNERVTPWIL